MRHQLVADYCTHRVARGVQPRSARNFASYLNVWHDHAGPVDQWTADLADQWVHSPTVRPGTRRNRLHRLRPYTTYLLERGVLTVDICADIATPKVPPANPRDLAPGDVTAALAHARDDRTRLVVLMMVQCGMRAVEVARALVEDIDARSRMLAVRGKGGGGHVTHHAAIPTELWDLLTRWVGELGRTAGPLVANERRLEPVALTPGHVSKLAYGPLRSAGLKAMPFDGVAPHALRHSCAQHMLDGGADIVQIQHQFGHRSRSTTELYLRRRPEGIAAAVEGRRYLDVA